MQAGNAAGIGILLAYPLRLFPLNFLWIPDTTPKLPANGGGTGGRDSTRALRGSAAWPASELAGGGPVWRCRVLLG